MFFCGGIVGLFFGFYEMKKHCCPDKCCADRDDYDGLDWCSVAVGVNSLIKFSFEKNSRS